MQDGVEADQYDIVVDGASKVFDGQAVVDEASFTVRRGEIFGFIGPSGSGKTTTIRMLTGVYRPSGGHIEVLGQQPAKFSRRTREAVGYLPQQFALYPNLSVLENMRFVASMYGISPWKRGKPIRQALEFVQLWDSRNKLASQLSGGMQKRLELASVLAHNPRVIFADEPTAGIDPVLRDKFWDEFKELREEGRTLFVTTQYVTEAEYCDHVALMADGRIVACDTPQGLRRLALGGEAVDIRASGLAERVVRALEKLEGVSRVERRQFDWLRIYVHDAASQLPTLLNAVEAEGIEVDLVEEYRPTFDDVFVLLLEQNSATGTAGAPGVYDEDSELRHEQDAERIER